MHLKKSPLFLASPLLLVGLLAGCVERPARTVIIERPAPPPSSVVVAEPSSPAPSVDVVIQAAPPPVRREVITVRPSHRHVWVAGHWVYRGGRYEWSNGHWALPPRAHAVYVSPRWERRGNGWIFIEGTWR